jgi:hypothetical protein
MRIKAASVAIAGSMRAANPLLASRHRKSGAAKHCLRARPTIVNSHQPHSRESSRATPRGDCLRVSATRGEQLNVDRQFNSARSSLALLTSAAGVMSTPLQRRNRTFRKSWSPVRATESRNHQPRYAGHRPGCPHTGRYEDRRPGEPIAAGIRRSERDGCERRDGYGYGEPARPQLAAHSGAGRRPASAYGGVNNSAADFRSRSACIACVVSKPGRWSSHGLAFRSARC